MKRSTLKPVSKKTAKLKRETDPERANYVKAHWLCQCCCKRPSVECHELVRGANREKALKERATWLAVCRTCHEDVLSDASKAPLAKQMAWKLVADPAWFSLEVVNQLRGRAPDAISLSDVARFLSVIGAEI